MAEQFTVYLTPIPKALADLGFVAWVADAKHPDLWPGSTETYEGLSVSWHQSELDAKRTADALNAWAER